MGSASLSYPPLVPSAPAALFGSHHGSKTAVWIAWCLIMGLLCSLCNVLYMSYSVVHDATRLKVKTSSSSSSLRHFPSTRDNLPQQLRNTDLSKRAVQSLPTEWKLPLTQDPIRQLLVEALGSNGKLQEIDPETMLRLPTVHDVTALYGPMPVVLGLETCDRFQHSAIMDVAEHLVSVAGSFNTGTNLLAELLIANCVMPERRRKYGTHGVRWQVLWGKHTPVDDESFRRSHRTYTNETGRNKEPPVVPEALFPGVTIRDPFKWMQSMCRHSYGAHWKHDPQHCPNLVPNAIDEALWEAENEPIPSSDAAIPVTVHYAEFHRNHTSLVGFWNDWNRAYAKAPFPRLMVRFEDIVFHPKQITQTVCECAGGQIQTDKPFTYVVDSAKKGAAHGKEKTSYVDALVKYGTEVGRYTGFTNEDLQYAVKHLDPDLMRLFGYRYPSPEVIASFAR